MKFNRILLAAVVLPQFAVAETAVTHQALATVQATLDFCAQVNPAAATNYRQQTGILVQGLAEEERDKLRAASEYREAYASTRDALQQVAVQDAVAACNGSLEMGRANK